MTGKAVPPVPLPDQDFAELQFGPAMMMLNLMQRRFAYGRVWLGLSKTDAARFAGYGTPEHNYWKVEVRPAVQLAIEELSRSILKTEAAASIRALVEVRDSTEAPPADRIRAANSSLDRAGLGVHTEKTLHVEHHLSDREKDARLIALADELGFDDAMKKKLLAPPAQGGP